jgi:REP element-mobilizing transposase RayT
MPRCARVKSFDSVYHIMVRSISEVELFSCPDDKDMYLHLIKKYQDTFFFKVYAYCLMDNHAHIVIDACGADISKIMHGINQCYAQYYNRVHKRRGHLFQDRFKSVIIPDDRALINVSAYVNKNPKDMDTYRDREQWYFYSSLGVYAGIREDSLHMLDTSFILGHFSRNVLRARKLYLQYVYKYDEDTADEMEFRHEKAEYRSERMVLVRDISPNQVIDFVSSYTRMDKSYINIKYIKDVSDMKALSALLMRCLCDMGEKAICSEMGNITQSHASRLYHRGIQLIGERKEYRNIIRDFLDKRAS